MDTGGDAIRLYKDNSSLERCEIRKYGDHVCDDIILVPVNSQQRVRYITLSAEDYVHVVLCEVQIFAGKSLYYYYCHYIIYIYQLYTCVVSTINCFFVGLACTVGIYII